jgi:hypothetical protein
MPRIISFPRLLLLLAASTLGLGSIEVCAQASGKSVDLLQDKNLAAWEYVVTPATDIKAVCTFKDDGVLAVAGKPIGYLATVATYRNYRLHAEWRWPADAVKNSNSGVLLHIAGGPVNGTQWPVCFQVQTKLTRAGDLLPMGGDAKFAEKLSTPPGARTPQLDRQQPSSEKPLGEWNACDIVCRDGAVDVTVNGVHQNHVTGCVPAAGRIGFQLEGMPYELRNVQIEPLK